MTWPSRRIVPPALISFASAFAHTGEELTGDEAHTAWEILRDWLLAHERAISATAFILALAYLAWWMQKHKNIAGGN